MPSHTYVCEVMVVSLYMSFSSEVCNEFAWHAVWPLCCAGWCCLCTQGHEAIRGKLFSFQVMSSCDLSSVTNCTVVWCDVWCGLVWCGVHLYPINFLWSLMTIACLLYVQLHLASIHKSHQSTNVRISLGLSPHARTFAASPVQIWTV